MNQLSLVFEDEISLIENPRISFFVQEVLDCVYDEYPSFFKAQASTTKKHHPTCCNVKGGIIRHVKRAFNIGANIAAGWALSKDDRDIVLAALILHDIRKDSYKHHAKLAGDFILKTFANISIAEQRKNRGLSEIVVKIVRAVRLHMGPWTEQSFKIPMESYTLTELATYTADYLASRKNISLPEDNFSLDSYEELKK